MKLKKITVILVFVLICAMSVLPVMAAAALPDNMVTLPAAPKATCVIDGVRDDGYGDWFNMTKLRNDATVGATGRFCTAWDDNNIYYYIEVNDTTPNHDSANAWDRDCVEFFVDWNSMRDTDLSNTDDPYWQIRIASAPDSNGEQNTNGGTSGLVGSNLNGDTGINYKVVPLVAGDTALAQGYVIEVALPIALATGAKPLKVGGSVIVDVQICDNQNGNARDSQSFLVPDDPDTDAQSGNPSACRGILPLGAAVVPGDPFARITVSPSTDVIDATADQGPNGQPVQYVDGYGIGYTWINDMAVFRNLDFGATGAGQMTVAFGFAPTDGQPDSSLLKIYVDDPNGAEAGEIRCTDTGGFDEANQKDFTFDCAVPSGVHTIYVKWAEAATGSLYGVQFTAAVASATPAADSAVPAPAVDNAAAPTAPVVTSAVQTGDNTLVIAGIMVLAAAGVVIFRRKLFVK
ncbi:MAG: LPXTG cell wall anchor domain-containing protein [Oscillospiraceae bacterium]|nr:LPXTG cell wall anchor domain-containing protein [Oscillospiraceae bacterium]